MYMLNRQTRYEIIKELIIHASDKRIKKLVEYKGFESENTDDIEFRRQELLHYLDEMHTCWNENNIDMIDRQYLKVIKPKK